MRYRIIAAALATLASVASAQGPEMYGTWYELRPFAGAYVPLGAQADAFKAGPMAGVQAAFEFAPVLHFVGTVGWTDGRNRFTSLSSANTGIWAYDLGFEYNEVKRLGRGWMLRPFAGAGGGGRTYDYRASEARTNTVAGGYGTLGLEAQNGILAYRLEVRDYLMGFENPVNGVTRTRNDLAVSVGLSFHTH